MSFSRYTKYKETIVGSVPEHWTVALVKRFLTVQSGEMISAEDETEDGFPLIGGNGERARTSRWNTPADTLVIGRVGARCGCVHHVTESFWASEHAFRVIAKREFSKRYFFHLLSWLNLNRFAIKTAQPLLNTDIVETQWISVPPLHEQESIARFLDLETSKIDELVAEQRRMIELLKEKRQAVISHFVTKGLNPNVPMKESGVEWLGDIPEHWDVCQSRRMFAVRSEPARDTDQVLTASQKYGVILQSDFVEREGRRVVEVILGVENLKHVEPDDFIISMRSFQGGLEWSRLRGSTSFHYVMVKPVKWVHPPFFAHLFKCTKYIQALRATTDLIRDGQELRFSNFSQVSLPVLPLEEQKVIADYLDKAVAQLDTLTVEAQKAIELFLERRAALVSSAVTGQIYARNLDSDLRRW